MRMVAVFAVLVLVASCATPQTDQSQTASAANSGEKKICKQVKVMGSNMPQRVCSTQAEWDAFNKQGQQTVEDYDRSKDAIGQ